MSPDLDHSSFFLRIVRGRRTAELPAGKPVAAVVKNEPGKGTSLGGGSAGTPGPSTSPTPTPGASSSDTAPQTGGSAAPDVSGAPGSSVSSTPSSKPAPTPTTHGSSAPVSSAPSVGGAVGSAGATLADGGPGCGHAPTMPTMSTTLILSLLVLGAGRIVHPV
jgi:hypothetical protein